jgi:hypothetical protein
MRSKHIFVPVFMKFEFISKLSSARSWIEQNPRLFLTFIQVLSIVVCIICFVLNCLFSRPQNPWKPQIRTVNGT